MTDVFGMAYVYMREAPSVIKVWMSEAQFMGLQNTLKDDHYKIIWVDGLYSVRAEQVIGLVFRKD